MTEAIRTTRLTRIYLIALPLLLLTGGLAVIIAYLLVPPHPAAIEAIFILLLGVLILPGLFSSIFLTVCHAQTKPSTTNLVLMFVISIIVGLHLGVLFAIAVYAITLYLVLNDPNRPSKPSPPRFLIPIAAVILLTLAISLGIVWLLTGDHYYSEPTIGKGGFYYTELIDASLDELVEVDETHCIGVYSYATDDPSRGIGFALYETKDKNGKPLYCYLGDSGLCFPFIDAIEECDGEYYTVNGHDIHGFPEQQTYSWSTWHRVSDGYAVCLIPTESECVPEEGIELVQSTEITLRGKAFRLYVGLGEVE